MFDSTRMFFQRKEPDRPDPSDLIRERCVHGASRWVMQRRVNRPWLPPQRLPTAARLG